MSSSLEDLSSVIRAPCPKARGSGRQRVCDTPLLYHLGVKTSAESWRGAEIKLHRHVAQAHLCNADGQGLVIIGALTHAHYRSWIISAFTFL